MGMIDIDLGKLVDGVSGLVDSVGNQIRGNAPVDLNKLAELEVKLKELKNNAEEIQEKSRASARILEGEYVKAGKKNWLQQFLGYGAILMLAFVIIALFKFDVKPDVNNLLMIIVGGLLKIVYDLYGYYFGSSSGSENKNNMISDIVSKLKK